MLAEAMQTPEEVVEYFGKPIVCEYKLDGIRAQCHKQMEAVKIFTRRGNESGDSFPEIVEALSEIDHDFIIDGEIVAFKEGKILPFSFLQHRLQRKILSRKLVDEVPLTIFVYDILYLDGEPLYNMTLVERKEGLNRLIFLRKLRCSIIFLFQKKRKLK